ncbi:MAG: PQQ-binding-like beta-propeller repeat protein, partial [Acidobacteriota bacterium]
VIAQGAQEPALFTARQAAQGKKIYAMRCAGCHGNTLQGGAANALAGPAFARAWAPAGKWASSKFTVDDLDFVIRTTMPKDALGKLSAADYTEVLTFILQQNGYKSGATPLRAGSPLMKKTRLRFGTTKEVAMAPPRLRIEGNPGAVPKGGGPTQEELNNAANSTHNWLYQTHDYSGSRYVALDQINDANAGQLQPACAFQVGGADFQTNPIVYQGTMYITSGLETIALNATNCRPKWKYTWTPRSRVVWPQNRGVAIKDGYLVRGTSDGYLLALNAATGKLIWAVKAADAAKGQTFTMAPLIYQNLILIGPAGSENGISGWVGAFRLRDGSMVWKFHTVPGATRTGRKSWANPEGIKLGGGAVWTPFSLDPKTGTLFVAVTNPAPDYAANLRPGDNLYTDSVVALNVHTGKLLWYKQMVPNDSHDWDLTQVSPLFHAELDGHQERLLATVGKDGILRTIDRKDHKVIYSTPVTTIRNAKVPVTAKGVVACPGTLGGVEWNGPALDRQLNMLYVNAVDWCFKYTSAEKVRYIPGQLYLGGSEEPEPKSQGWLTAVDASTGAVKRKYRSSRPMCRP